MKTFKDLEFTPWFGAGGIRASMDFSNGYGVSVIQGECFYTNGTDEYELAVMKGDALCYDSGITEDVLGHLSKRQVTKYMKLVQALKKKRKK